MALYGDLTHDSRVRREAATLAGAGYDVTIVCLAADTVDRAPDLPASVRVLVVRPTRSSIVPGSPNPFFKPSAGRLAALVSRLRWLRDYVRNVRAWGRSVLEATGPVDLWHVHDFTALAGVAPRLAAHVPFVYDTHELYLEIGTARRLPRPARILLRAYERRLVRRAAAVVTVNASVAEILSSRYRPKRIEVIHNCPERWSLPSPRPALLREAATIPVDSAVILYHGALFDDRGIEQLFAALLAPGMERAHLVLMGAGDQRETYVATADQPAWGGRVHVLDPVPPFELLTWVASADVGAMPIRPSTLNHVVATPNKLFECLAAGVPVVVSDFPTMRRIVLDDPGGPLGATCDPSSPPSVAAALRSLLELDPAATEALRARCLAAARERWNWSVESARLLDLYEGLTASGSQAGAHFR
jgi:glycosyltransferase involved in cell wall biosynthesis